MRVTVDGYDVILHSLTFSGGELQPRLKNCPQFGQNAEILAHLRSSDDIMSLLLTTDAIRAKYGNIPIDVTIPYFPYARQDRVCYSGEALSVRVMANLINSQNYRSVTIWDPHSNVTSALINNCKVIKAEAFVSRLVTNHTILVCPDAGAKQRVQECADRLDLSMIECSKKRDPNDGSLTDVEVPLLDNYKDDLDFLIVDDICDGGRTFINLAKKLRKEMVGGRILLYVTHGIFSQGLRVFDDIIDLVYCANPWPLQDNNGMVKVNY